MTQQDIKAAARTQLAKDLGCAPALLDTPDNVVVEWQEVPGRRAYSDDTPFFEAAIWNGKLVAAANAALLPWCRDHLLPRQAEWLFLPHNYRRLERGLATFGYQIGDARHFYLPTLPFPAAVPIGSVRWYEQADLEPFRGENTWDEALAFNAHTPDMLAVAALDKTGCPIAMAGASRDGAHLWQIGIRVLPSHMGRGLGINLAALLKDELMLRDIAPLYSTAESHIASQNVGIRAGFLPAFGYLYAQRVQAKG